MYVIPGPYHHSGRVLVSFRFDNDSHLDRRPRPDLVSVFLAPVGCRSDGVMRSMQLRFLLGYRRNQLNLMTTTSGGMRKTTGL